MRNRKPVPVYGQTSHVIWSVSRDRKLLSIFGAGAATMPDVTSAIGMSIDDVHRERPHILAIIDRLLAGEVIHERAEYDGSIWMVEAAPCYDNGEVCGCAGVSFQLGAVDPPKKHAWKVSGLPQGRHGHLRNGDVFVKTEGVPGVAQGSRCSDAEFMETMLAYSRYLEPVTSPSSPCPDPVQPVSVAGRRRLQLLL
jgi:hypothetical protein